jgi:hypothetical protein
MTVMRRYPNESHITDFYSPQVPGDAHVLAGQLWCAKWLKRSQAPGLTSGRRTASHPQPARLRPLAGGSGQGVTGSEHEAFAAGQALRGLRQLAMRRLIEVVIP